MVNCTEITAHKIIAKQHDKNDGPTLAKNKLQSQTKYLKQKRETQ